MCILVQPASSPSKHCSCLAIDKKSKMQLTTALRWLAVTTIALPGPAAAATDKLLSSRAANADQLAAASRIVDDAIAKMTVLNKARLDNPMRNQYRSKPAAGIKHRSSGDGDSPPPLLEITPEIAAAAALVAEVDRTADLASNTSAPVQRRAQEASAFWMESIKRKGTVPWGNDPGYKVCALLSCISFPI